MYDMASQRANRFKAEMEMLTKNPPPGIVCLKGDSMDVITAEITGPPGSPFEKGTFTVEVSLSERYPFTPPNAKFVTPIYHPNVDSTGRICLSGLKPKPAGTWNCSMNIAVILSAIRLLMSEPNLGDPLMADIATEYKDNLELFRNKARAHTSAHAVKRTEANSSDDGEPDALFLDSSEITDKEPEEKVANTVINEPPTEKRIAKNQTKAKTSGSSSKAVIEEIQLSSDSDDESTFLNFNPRKKLKTKV